MPPPQNRYAVLTRPPGAGWRCGYAVCDHLSASCRSGPLDADGGHVDRVELVGAGDEEAVALRTAEGEVGDVLREVELAEDVALRGKDVDGRAGARPEIAVGVDAEAVGDAVLELEAGLAALQAVVLADLEGPDVARRIRIVGAGRIGDIKLRLVRRKGEAVRLVEIVGDDGEFS